MILQVQTVARQFQSTGSAGKVSGVEVLLFGTENRELRGLSASRLAQDAAISYLAKPLNVGFLQQQRPGVYNSTRGWFQQVLVT